MYNDRTQMTGAMFRGTMSPRQASPVRDLPNSERQDNSMPRRRCDGSLHNPNQRQDNSSPYNCVRGDCGKWGLTNHPLAMVYSPCQSWQNAYAPDVALERGTLFSELDLPFTPSKCRKGGM